MKQVKTPKSNILLTVPRRYFLCGSFVIFVSCVSYVFAPVHCCLVLNCWKRLTSDVSLSFATFLCGILGQVWYLIVSFPDICSLSYVDLSITIIIVSPK